jgi:prepilin-type N-terminal cleavage/methylation domain-containing protein
MIERSRAELSEPRASLPCSASSRAGRAGVAAHRAGFTLIELLVVITIILLISAVALPTIIPALSHRQVSEGARIFQAALAGARDDAIRNGAPSGLRLLPDPNFSGINPTTGLLDPTLPLAYNRIIPVGPAPDYSEGRIDIVVSTPLIRPGHSFNSLAPITYPVPNTDGATGPYPYGGLAAGNIAALNPNANVLMVEQSSLDPTMTPTSWFWNIRVGDRIQINNTGQWYTVVGPMAITEAGGNPELFVNVGPPGTPSPLVTPAGNPEFLFLVNGRDDNGDGWVDEGWDGVNNNIRQEITANVANNNRRIDDVLEWEQETWLGTFAATDVRNRPYTIERRPAPQITAREVSLPSGVVIDATTWGAERTRVPAAAFNHFSGVIEFLVNPDGSVVPTTGYSSPSSVGMDGAFFHFWLAERTDVYAPTINTLNPNPPPSTPLPPSLPLPQGMAPGLFLGNTELKGEYRLVTLFSRTGQISTLDNMPFDNPASIGGTYSVNVPFLQSRLGVSGASQ